MKLRLSLLATVYLLSLVGSLCSPYPAAQTLTQPGSILPSPPDAKHILGTDELGHDVFAFLCAAYRESFTLAFLLSGGILVLGYLLGLAQAWGGPRIDFIGQRLGETLQAFPLWLILLFLGTAYGGKPLLTACAYLFFGWVGVANHVRKSSQEICAADYFCAARLSGMGNWQIWRRHLFPYHRAQLAALIPLVFASAFTTNLTLEFFGTAVTEAPVQLSFLLAQAARHPQAGWILYSTLTVTFLPILILMDWNPETRFRATIDDLMQEELNKKRSVENRPRDYAVRLDEGIRRWIARRHSSVR